MADARTRLFSDDFDDEFPIGDDARVQAFFGRDVLRGLVAGIDEFVTTYRDGSRSSRDRAPALLACAPWIDDEQLLAKLSVFGAACVVMTKQSRSRKQVEKLKRLQEVNATSPGLPVRPFPDLGWLAPKVDGEPLVVGPYTRTDDTVLPTIRTVGFRKKEDADLPPLMHAKLVLLGDIRWWEGEFGEEVESFSARRLWVSSANLTESSRRSLEFGFWSEEKALIDGAERFLLKLVAASEGIDPDADELDPELVPFEIDDEAMWQAMADARWGDEDPDP